MKIRILLLFCLPVFLSESCVLIFTPKNKKVFFTFEEKDNGKITYNEKELSMSGQYLKIPRYNGPKYEFAYYQRSGYKKVSLPIERKRFNALYALDLHPLFLLLDAAFGANKSIILSLRDITVDSSAAVKIPVFDSVNNYIRHINVHSSKVKTDIHFYNRLKKYQLHAACYSGSFASAAKKSPYVYYFREKIANALTDCGQFYTTELDAMGIYKRYENDLLSVPYNMYSLDVNVEYIGISHVQYKKWTSTSPAYNDGLTKAEAKVQFRLISYNGKTVADTVVAIQGNFFKEVDKSVVHDALGSALYQFLNNPGVQKIVKTQQQSAYHDVLVLKNTVSPAKQLNEAVSSTVTIQSDGLISSGCIISSDGYIVGNLLSVPNPDNIKVTLNNNRKFRARLVRSSPGSNCMLLSIDTTGLQPVSADFDINHHVAKYIYIAGTPLHANLHNSLSRGFLSAIRTTPSNTFLQTNAVINYGMKGGAILSDSGKLLGLVNHRLKSASTSKITFGISISDICRTLNIRVENG